VFACLTPKAKVPYCLVPRGYLPLTLFYPPVYEFTVRSLRFIAFHWMTGSSNPALTRACVSILMPGEVFSVTFGNAISFKEENHERG